MRDDALPCLMAAFRETGLVMGKSGWAFAAWRRAQRVAFCFTVLQHLADDWFGTYHGLSSRSAPH
jgi:hypothetical protein